MYRLENNIEAKNMLFRNDITGLRGIANIIIFLYHYDKQYVSGGLIGVDIFFTITGYFITKSIIESFESNCFSYLKFYSNRIKKLLPVCYSLWLFLLAIYNLNIKKTLVYDIVYSILGVINYRFYNNSIDYLSKEDKPSPLLHFWTLSLQQQFYIVCPFLLILISKYNIFILIFIIILSFICCCYYSIYDISYSYFSFSTRLWEIGFGSMFYFFNQRRMYLNNVINNNILIIMIILFSLYFNSEIYSYPNYFTLIPVICSCMIIISRESNNKVLSNYFLIFNGNISYSLYIIHYPFLQFFPNIKLIEAVLLIYSISIISFNNIETKYQSIRFSPFYIIIVSLFLNLLIINISILLVTKYKRKSKFIFEEISGYNDFMKMQKSFLNCPLNNITPDFSNSHKFVLLGDCHIQQWLPVINKMAFSYGYIVFHIYYWAYYIEKGNFKEIFELLNSIGLIDLIFLSQYLSYKPYMLNYTIFTKHFINYLHELNNFNFTKDVYIIQNTGFNKRPVQNYLKAMNNPFYGYLGINFTRYLLPTISSIKIIDMNSYICQNNKCPFIIDDYIVYIDRHHLNPSFVEHLYPFFYKKISIKYIKRSKSIALKKKKYYKNAICCNWKWRIRKCIPKGD